MVYNVKKAYKGFYALIDNERFGVIILNEKEQIQNGVPEEISETEIDQWLDNLLKEEPVAAEEPIETEEPARVRKTKGKKKATWQENVLMYLHDLAMLLAGLVLVFLLLFRVVVVSGTSMNNTLLDGDYLLLLSSTFYNKPQYGDVIVASKESFDNGKPIVKRVIATEGQWVDIDFVSGVVYVGDTKETMMPLDEPYTRTPTNTDEGIDFPLQVAEGCLFVMGDNRNGSKDSRHPEIGLVDEREILGKVFFLFIPGTNYGQEEKDFGRIGVVS